MTVTIDVLGRGFAFPFGFDTATGGVKGSRGVVSVEDGLIFIFGTYLRERFLRPQFGSKINNILFSLKTPEQEALLKAYIQEAARQEPRVEVITQVTVEQDDADDHQLLVTVFYRVIRQPDERNLVIPLRRE